MNLKYEISVYEETEFHPEDIENFKQKIVKTRTGHKCCDCGKEIIIKEYALRESGFYDGMPVSCYLCIECCDKYLDEIYGDYEEGEE